MAKGRSGKVNKIKKYRKPLNINIGMVIFAVIFIYVLSCIGIYFKDNHVVPYIVKQGSLSVENIYRGITLREEHIVSADAAGYVNYYAREGERVAVGDLVYTIDETGRLTDYLNADELGENSLSDRDLSQLKSEIVNFTHSFTPDNFSVTYDFKYSVKGTVLKLANNALMQNIQDLNGGSSLQNMVDFSKANTSGIVEYWTDGYEELQPENVTAAIFEDKEYEKIQLINNELIAQGDPVYKVSPKEEWSVVIPIEEERGTQLQAEGYVKVKFLKNQYEIWGQTTLLHNADGNSYLKLDFTNSMLTFAGDRFVDIELVINDTQGLKIPNSSIVEKEFYLVPEGYITQSGDSGSSGVLRETALEDGTLTTEYIQTNVYNVLDGEYYLDTAILRGGDRLIMPDSTETYVVSKRATLIGVYNMNKGYADFRQIDILYQNEEYSIVKSNTDYGLNVYDYIVLDAEYVNENQFIYE